MQLRTTREKIDRFGSTDKTGYDINTQVRIGRKFGRIKKRRFDLPQGNYVYTVELKGEANCIEFSHDEVKKHVDDFVDFEPKTNKSERTPTAAKRKGQTSKVYDVKSKQVSDPNPSQGASSRSQVRTHDASDSGPCSFSEFSHIVHYYLLLSRRSAPNLSSLSKMEMTIFSWHRRLARNLCL